MPSAREQQEQQLKDECDQHLLNMKPYSKTSKTSPWRKQSSRHYPPMSLHGGKRLLYILVTVQSALQRLSTASTSLRDAW